MTMKPGAMNRKKPNYKGTKEGAVRFAKAVATGGKSELARAVSGAATKAVNKRAANSKGGYNSKRSMYGHGGEVMPKAKPC